MAFDTSVFCFLSTMEHKKNLFVSILTILAVLLVCMVLVRGFIYAPSDEVDLPASAEKSLMKNVTPQGEEKSESVLYPKRLRIPSIETDAKVQYVGFTKKGNMATPRNFGDVGWFRYGTLPGEVGSAVIAGHLDNGFSFPAVFNHLDELEEGDDIYVDTVGGKTIHFVVSETRAYDYKASTEEIFSAKGGESRLVLITCTGSWISKERTH